MCIYVTDRPWRVNYLHIMSKKHPLSMVQISVISRLKLLALYFKYKRKQSHSSTIVKGLHLPRICLPAEIRLLYALLSQQIQCVKVFLCTCHCYQVRQTETVCKNNEFHGIQIWARAEAASIEILQHSTHAASCSVWKQHLTKHSNKLKEAFSGE